MSKALEGKIALITGASRGIGRSVALRYAAEGAHVILVAKTIAALEEVDDEIQALGGQATLVPMNLREFDKIDQMGQALHDRFGKIDIVVGNAGVLGDLTPMSQLKIKMWNEVMDVNVTANWRLIRSMEPLLRQSDAGRAIFLSSGTTKAPRAFWAAYAVSKAALENMVQTWAEELHKTNIKVNLIDPGATRTRMRAQAYPGEDPMDLKTPEELADLFLELALPTCEKHGEVVRYS